MKSDNGKDLIQNVQIQMEIGINDKSLINYMYLKFGINYV